VIFFNDVGYLVMCGHGTSGLLVTLAHMGRIGVGEHRIETPVGTVTAILHDSGEVTVSNVESYRSAASLVIGASAASAGRRCLNSPPPTTT
jgi:4-hydroxyproline epimerase